MATDPVIVFHDGKFDVPEQLQEDLKLHEGARFRVVSSNDHITLEPQPVPTRDVNRSTEGWRKLEGVLAHRRWTPEKLAAAEERKRAAQDKLDRLYETPEASLNEIRSAEREWELADDELDLGPFD